MQQPSRLPPAHMTRQPHAGSTLVHRHRLWQSSMQHWTVLSDGSGVSTEYKYSMYVKCWASVAGAEQYPFSPSQYFMMAVPA